MVNDSIARLNEGQKEVLRLIGRGYGAKEIASELGVSPDGVKKRLAGARNALGVTSSRQAARILAQAEGVSLDYTSWVAPRSAVSDQDVLVESNVRAEDRDFLDAPQGTLYHQSILPPNEPSRSLFPFGIGAGNRLTAAQRVVVIITMSMGTAVALFFMVATLRAVSDVLSR
jgi:DNA-binding CsgD family transcriptional regulator